MEHNIGNPKPLTLIQLNVQMSKVSFEIISAFGESIHKSSEIITKIADETEILKENWRKLAEGSIKCAKYFAKSEAIVEAALEEYKLYFESRKKWPAE
jgi:hypothetical protein